MPFSSNNNNNNNESKNIFIYELPFMVWSNLCKTLNHNNKWMELAGAWMNYDAVTISQISNEKNPSDELLTQWGHFNHKTEELFVLLSRMQHYQAMSIIKPFVHEKYHVLLNRGEGNLYNRLPQRPIGNNNNNNLNKDSKIGIQNFNKKPLQDEQQQQQQQPASKVPAVVQLPKHIIGADQIAATSLFDLLIKESSLPQISYEELTLATSSWSINKLLGQGGFGKVFKGTWKNTQVAIKKLERQLLPTEEGNYIQQLEQSLREVVILNSLPHDNILPLYGFSVGSKTPACLVYQLMANGSLQDRLLLLKNNNCPKVVALTWIQRHNIAKGVAKGLQYLHNVRERPLIHGDIKSANILLDSHYQPKIGDFGLAREAPAKVDPEIQVSKVQGTRPYLPNDFLTTKILSTKVDTYSYGIVLFELSTGLKAYDDSRDEFKFLKDFIEYWGEDESVLADTKAGNDYYGTRMQVFENLMALGKWCSNRKAAERPEMALVFTKLDKI